MSEPRTTPAPAGHWLPGGPQEEIPELTCIPRETVVQWSHGRVNLAAGKPLARAPRGGLPWRRDELPSRSSQAG